MNRSTSVPRIRSEKAKVKDLFFATRGVPSGFFEVALRSILAGHRQVIRKCGGKKIAWRMFVSITVWEISPPIFSRRVRWSESTGRGRFSALRSLRVCGFVAPPADARQSMGKFHYCPSRARVRQTPHTTHLPQHEGQSSWLPLSPPTSSLASAPSSSACARDDGEAISGTIRSHWRAPRRERFSFRRVRPERAPRDLAQHRPARAIPGTNG